MPTKNNLIYQKIGAAAGIASPIVALTCVLVAVASYSPFSWTNNALSDLGVVSGATATVFNLGLASGGVLSFVFSMLGLSVFLGRNAAGKIGSALFAAANIALVGIGVFNESYSGTHFAFSVAFFVLSPIALFILTVAFGVARQKIAAVCTVLTACASALPWILLYGLRYVPNVAVPEFASGLAVSAWTIGLSVRILKPAAE